MMGCSLSVVLKSPKKVGVGQWVQGEKQLTLLEKWFEFRDWVRRNRGKKTKVFPINIEPLGSNLVKTSSNTAIVNGDDISERSASSFLCQESGLQDQAILNVDGWLNQHQVTMDTQCYSPVLGIATKKMRPKAARGARTIVPPLKEQVQIPGGVLIDEELGTEKVESESGSLGRGRCPVILMLGEDLCVPVEGNRMESTQKDRITSGRLWRRIRPKAAKGKRSVSSVQGKKHFKQQIPDSQQACLEAWMKRKLVQEGEL